MGKKCSYCRAIGHNTRTCNNYYKSTPTLARVQSHNMIFPFPSPSPSLPLSSLSPSLRCSFASSKVHIDVGDGLSEVLLVQFQEKKRGAPWSEDEHKAFLVGLEKMGRGDWRGISHNFVTTRTPTQIASHAQKYFLKQTSVSKKKRSSSLIDMVESGTTANSGVTTTISGDNELLLPPPPSLECHNMERHDACYQSGYSGLQFKSSKARRMATERLSSKEAPDLELTLRLLCH